MRINTSDDQLHHALSLLGTNTSFAETVEQLASGGTPHDMVRAMAAYPPILEAMEVLGNGIYPGGNLPRELKELIILQSSIANSCQFCTQSHVDMARALGMSETPAELLQHAQDLPAPQQAALQYADAIRENSNRITDAQFESLREHFTEAQIVELTFLIGYINMLNWFNNALQVQYRGELAS
ncbi:MAG: carboxymuconolactone decarboxylase family protein [Phycisphaerales bacterium]|jgi:AhpD family alkylhydroperoxidase|nr:carboxymuconolactone decarboxylase family protein [Phycisphaerales bacterium]MDP6987524.1 carboxymuconolactone decarboxylase family protein [Phycisphaerales bacterium]